MATRELTTDLRVLERLVALDGRDVLDVGCGGGVLVRELASRGARAVGLEISEHQLGQARATGIGHFVVGRAEALPLPDGSLDAVLFMRSLHHVPPPAMLAALADARRVLRPDGVVYIAEPLAEGDYFELVRIVDDESEVRGAAQRAVAGCERAGLVRGPTLEYAVGALSTGIDRLRRRIVDVDPGRAAVFDAHEDELAAAFAPARRGNATVAAGSPSRCGPTCCTSRRRSRRTRSRLDLGKRSGRAPDGLRQSRPYRTAGFAAVPGDDELRHARKPSLDARRARGRADPARGGGGRDQLLRHRRRLQRRRVRGSHRAPAAPAVRDA